jgi:hypothetical protein
MAMALDRPGFAGTHLDDDRRDERRPLAEDASLHVLVARRDDRLLRDVGLTREDVLGPQGYFWSEWTRIRAPWSL